MCSTSLCQSLIFRFGCGEEYPHPGKVIPITLIFISLYLLSYHVFNNLAVQPNPLCIITTSSELRSPNLKYSNTRLSGKITKFPPSYFIKLVSTALGALKQIPIKSESITAFIANKGPH